MANWSEFDRKERPYWTDGEMEAVLDRKLSDEDAASLLPNRTARSVNQKRRRLRKTAFRYCKFCGKKTVKARNALYCEAHTRVYASWKSVEYGAEKRGYEFDLSLEDFAEIAWQKPCTYCRSKQSGYGIDRIDNNKGYSKDNCVSCCLRCNSMKSDQSLEQWLEQMRVASRGVKRLLKSTR